MSLPYPISKESWTPIAAEHLSLLEGYYRPLPAPLADINAFMMVAWQRALDLRFRLEEGVLFVIAMDWQGQAALWGPPVGDPVSLAVIERAFDLLRAAAPCQASHEMLYLWEDYPLWPLLRSQSRFEVEPLATEFLYGVRDLACLATPGLRKKRREVQRFVHLHLPRVAPYSADRAPDCLEVLRHWHQIRSRSVDRIHSTKLTLEHSVCRQALESHLPLNGVVVYKADRPVAFSIGAPHGGSTFNCMFEKADPLLPGAAAFVYHALAVALDPDFDTINAGEDWGIDYLRRSKESWRPAALVQNFLLRERR